MEKNFPRIKNFNVSVKEVDGKIIFVRKLEKGGSEHSFGIHVAEIAGMPRSIVKRANIILKELEKDNSQVGSVGKAAVERLDQSREGVQLSFSNSMIPSSRRFVTKSSVLMSTTLHLLKPLIN